LTHPRAIVVGGSVGGLFAANLLRTAGWDAEVFERARSDLADRGAGIGTKSELFSVLKLLGIELDPTIGFEVNGRQMLDRLGSVVHRVEQRQVTSGWSRVYRPLRQALPENAYHSGCSLVRVESRASSVTAVFADGSSADGDLLVAADGVNSTVRSQLLPEVKPQYAGYVCWRGVVEAGALSAQSRALLGNRMTFALPEHELIMTLPTPGERWYFVWFRPADEEQLAALCTDASGREHGGSIPPDLIRPEVLAKMKGDGAATLPPPMADLIGQVDRPLLHGVFDLECPRLVFDRVALLGDAAFVARPHVATGVTKAALDARCLADALARLEPTEALRAYDAERRAFGAELVARGRTLGSHLEPGEKSAKERSAAAFHRRPEILLAEYGSEGRMVRVA
jgi:2-polyprenyl-6-methoxyphenol hydroxylase-like FAD-dependent oxidoreductase